MQSVMLIGAGYALLTAIFWGFAPVLIKRVVTRDVSPLLFSAIRSPFALSALLLITYITGDIYYLFSVTFPSLFIIFIASVSSLVFADTMYFTGIKKAGVSISTPIAFTYPLPALLFAYILLNEEINAALYLGTILIVSGIFLITYQKRDTESQRNILKGVAFVFMATIGWSFGLTIMKIALLTVSPLIVSVYRTFFLMIMLSPYAIMKRTIIRRINRMSLFLVAVAGIIGLGFGALTLFISLVYIGAARGSAISASAPLFSALFAAIFLKEKLRFFQVIGILITLIGTWVIILS